MKEIKEFEEYYDYGAMIDTFKFETLVFVEERDYQGDSITWKESAKEMLDWIVSRDWEGCCYDNGNDELKKFKVRATEILKVICHE